MGFGNYGNGYYMPNYYAPAGAMPDVLNQYKGAYAPMMPQQPMPNQMQAPPVNDLIFVLGEVEATSYPVAPNNTVVLWDKDRPTVFIKSVNAQGVPSMKVLDYTERSQNASKSPESRAKEDERKIPTAEAFERLESKIDALTAKFEALSTSNAPNNKEVNE